MLIKRPHGRTHAESFGVSRWKTIAEQTKGIAFIATPHSGANIANFAEFASLLYRTNEHVKELSAHSSRLRELHGWFLNFLQQQSLCCRTYCETQEVRPNIPILGIQLSKGILVVDQTSAEPNIPGERAIPLTEDHVSICKPISKTVGIYPLIHSFLKGCLTPLPKPPNPVENTVLNTAAKQFTETLVGVQCLIARDEEIAELTTIKMPESRLLTVFIEGHRHQCPENLLKRIRLEGQLAVHWRGGENPDFIEIEWPQRQIKKPEESCAKLLERLKVRVGASSASSEAIRTALNDCPAPRVFYSFLDESSFDAKQLALLEAWLKSWHTVAVGETQTPSDQTPLLTPVVLLFCCFYGLEQSDKSWLARLFRSNEPDMRHLIRNELPLRVAPHIPQHLPELGDVKVPHEIVKWLDEKVLKHCPAWRAKINHARDHAPMVYQGHDWLPMLQVLQKLPALKLVD